MQKITVLVLVDDRKEIVEFRMTRVACYYVEATESAGIPVDHSEFFYWNQCWR